MLWSGSQAALVHIGDGRAYLLRGGELSQLTQDHTYVQSLVDQRKLAPDEAASHPASPRWPKWWEPIWEPDRPTSAVHRRTQTESEREF
jgi:serine/threonine protein phosphatase PrpC